MEEHHGIKNHYWPSPLMVLAGFATRTQRVLLGTDVVVLPFYHPVQIAEQAAMLDVISSGRAVLEAPLEKRGARFEEQLEIIRRLWTEDDVSFEGAFHQLRGAKIEPKPLQ